MQQRISLYISVVVLFTGFHLFAQMDEYPDKLILLSNDTISVSIPADPRKETDLPKKSLGLSDDYGFLSIVVFFPNDSVRIITPDQIKGYYRASPGKLVGSGWFESRDVKLTLMGMKRSGDRTRKIFLQRINRHRDLSIYFYREAFGGESPDRYYFLEYGKDADLLVFMNYKKWREWADRTPPFNEIVQTLSKPNGKSYNLFNYFRDVGREYGKRFQ